MSKENVNPSFSSNSSVSSPSTVEAEEFRPNPVPVWLKLPSWNPVMVMVIPPAMDDPDSDPSKSKPGPSEVLRKSKVTCAEAAA